jgi:aminoglycoside phosphotransferase (APT) family kinase protein
MDLQDEARAVRSGEGIDPAVLNAFLRTSAPDMGEVLEIRQFPGGFSNLTYSLRTAGREYVLRRPPLGANIKSAHDMGREFRVLSLLKDHYPKIPQPVIFCPDETVLGSPFYIMERVQGLILRAHTAPKMGLSAEQMRRSSLALVDNLVALHALDIEATGLAQLGKPAGYVQRQVEGWIKRYRQAQTDALPALDTMAEWLPANLPPEQAPAFLHNDYKYDNVLLNPDDLGDIRGVLDWEMSTIGDPLMDLGAALAYWSEADDAPAYRQFNLTWLPGNLTRREVTERYATQSGRDLRHIHFYHAFGLYKNAVIAQQIYARWKAGHSRDERFGQLLPVIEALGKKAVEVI